MVPMILISGSVMVSESAKDSGGGGGGGGVIGESTAVAHACKSRVQKGKKQC